MTKVEGDRKRAKEMSGSLGLKLCEMTGPSGASTLSRLVLCSKYSSVSIFYPSKSKGTEKKPRSRSAISQTKECS